MSPPWHGLCRVRTRRRHRRDEARQRRTSAELARRTIMDGGNRRTPPRRTCPDPGRARRSRATSKVRPSGRWNSLANAMASAARSTPCTSYARWANIAPVPACTTAEIEEPPRWRRAESEHGPEFLKVLRTLGIAPRLRRGMDEARLTDLAKIRSFDELSIGGGHRISSYCTPSPGPGRWRTEPAPGRPRRAPSTGSLDPLPRTAHPTRSHARLPSWRHERGHLGRPG